MEFKYQQQREESQDLMEVMKKSWIWKDSLFILLQYTMSTNYMLGILEPDFSTYYLT